METLEEEQISGRRISNLAVNRFVLDLQCDLRRPVHGNAYSDRIEALFVCRKTKTCAVDSDIENKGSADEALSINQHIGEPSARLPSSHAAESIACAVSMTRQTAPKAMEMTYLVPGQVRKRMTCRKPLRSCGGLHAHPVLQRVHHLELC